MRLVSKYETHVFSTDTHPFDYTEMLYTFKKVGDVVISIETTEDSCMGYLTYIKIKKPKK